MDKLAQIKQEIRESYTDYQIELNTAKLLANKPISALYKYIPKKYKIQASTIPLDEQIEIIAKSYL